jgi:hypothetical protein
MRIDSATMNDDITTSLRGLNKLAKILKKGRIEKGCVSQISTRYILVHLLWCLHNFWLLWSVFLWIVMNRDLSREPVSYLSDICSLCWIDICSGTVLQNIVFE